MHGNNDLNQSRRVETWQKIAAALQFLFEYCIDTELYKKLAQLVYLYRQDLSFDSSNQMMSLAGSGLKMEEDHLNI